MKMAAELRPVLEVENEGLISFLNKRITIFCMNYIYTGTLVGVNDSCVKITDGGIVFNTGDFCAKTWEDYQKLPNDFYVQLSSVESFTELKP